LLCTLFTGSLSRKNIENNFSSRLLALIKLPVELGPHRHHFFGRRACCVFAAARSTCAGDFRRTMLPAKFSSSWISFQGKSEKRGAWAVALSHVARFNQVDVPASSRAENLSVVSQSFWAYR
jgi:hypothetical protein